MNVLELYTYQKTLSQKILFQSNLGWFFVWIYIWDNYKLYMKLYIKWYYGYKNLGDELLLIWLINFWLDKYKPSYIYIESGDIHFLSNWINKNQSYIKFDINKIQIVTKWQYIYQYYKFRNCHKIIWWWECISPVAKFPNWWRKYILWFVLDIIRSNYSICWGIGTPNQSSKLLYKILLSKARSIMVRDPESQNIWLIYNNKTELYHDFAIDVLDIYKAKLAERGWKSYKEKYILLNLKQSEYNPANLQLIQNFIAKYPNHKYIYIANFVSEDMCFEALGSDLDIYIEYFDRTDKSLDEILDLFEWCEWWWWVRLHFLMILKMLGKNYEYIYYQEKIRKLIW